MKEKKCKHKNRVDANFFYDEHGVIEYDTFCGNCGKHLGHWAYGYYDTEYTLNYELKGIKKIMKNNDLPF